jgi:hypothetical protein
MGFEIAFGEIDSSEPAGEIAGANGSIRLIRVLEIILWDISIVLRRDARLLPRERGCNRIGERPWPM